MINVLDLELRLLCICIFLQDYRGFGVGSSASDRVFLLTQHLVDIES